MVQSKAKFIDCNGQYRTVVIILDSMHAIFEYIYSFKAWNKSAYLNTLNAFSTLRYLHLLYE